MFTETFHIQLIAEIEMYLMKVFISGEVNIGSPRR
jgi:hypothetical protein